MNKLLPLAIAATLAAAAQTASAASDGTLDFIGEVTANTCTINASTSPNMTINLPRIDSSLLNGKDSTAGATRFVIQIRDCVAGPTLNNARAYFEPNPTLVDYPNNALKNLETAADKAEGIGVALFDETSRARIKIGMYTDHGTSWIPMTATGVDLGYEAAYVQTSATPVVAGKVKSQVQYSIEYN